MHISRLLILLTISIILSTAKKRNDPNRFKHFKIPAAKIREFQSTLQNDGGLVLRRGDLRYKQYVTPWNLQCIQKPQLVILPKTHEQASQALMFIKKYDESFVIMSGGHDYECESNTDRVLLSLALLNQIRVDPARQLVTLGPGARWGDIYKVLQPLGYDIPGGQCPEVGVGGYLLGTGFNWLLSRFYGSGAQNTVELKVVLADGSIRVVNWVNQYKDLMWGLLGGGGGQFGLVVQFTMKIHRQPPGGYHVTFLTYKFQEGTEPEINGEYTLDKLKPIYKEWISTMNGMQDDFSIGGNTLLLARNFTNFETREYRLAFAGFCRGDQCNWKTRLSQVLKKFPANVRYLGSRSTFLDFGIVGQIVPLVAGYPMETHQCSQPSALFNDFHPEMIDNIIDFFIPPNGDTEVSKKYYALDAVSFKGSVKDHLKTSFGFPFARWKTSLVILTERKVDSRIIERGKKFFYKTIQESLKGRDYGVYLNYIDHYVQDWKKLYFGNNYPKLQQIKSMYDPDDVFKRNYVAVETMMYGKTAEPLPEDL